MHLSDVEEREEWRRISVIRDLCIGHVQGKGVDGYREALEMLKERDEPMSVSVESRTDRLTALLAERELDSLLVTDLVNVRYLTGFTGTNGACVVRRERAAVRHRLPLRRAGGRAGARLRDRAGRRATWPATWPGGCAAAPASTTPTSPCARTRSSARSWPTGVELVAAGGLVEELRAVKDAGEVEAIRAAAAIADEVYEHLRERGLAGRTEREVALELEAEMQARGAEGTSFPPIVAAGAHGALPHAEPRDVEIPADTLVVIDMGAMLDGYCSDCTRTFATGALDERGARGLRAGARRPAAGAGGGAAGHRLPRARRRRARDDRRGRPRRALRPRARPRRRARDPRGAAPVQDAPDGELAAGNVVTVEPGVYLPGEVGVRIEDLVIVGDAGTDVLTSFTKELVVAA